ncbi:mannonate dehydratase [Mucilaginibacter sp. ZT4R22]|uniref:Mannonate dehydratase n=1 Tax=Mucilaginibacter pankratovii TaxID=2772110 RepID=A0ABR7WJD3_9SPHI|nr:mannonate dehydratase [Mucilaginibacter pankratovii]MBD1362441.1 mannonate dehydratase [Mucilaginibacter pankratovii]
MVANLQQTFRWFGPSDPVTLQAIRQTGASGIVSALHHIPCGEVWSFAEIQAYQANINAAGFNWAVVESVNIHEAIKTGTVERDKYIERYITTLAKLGRAGIGTVCYNFMPVLDWTRTHLDHRLANNASALRYDASALATFDLYILERAGAYEEFTTAQQVAAKHYLDRLSASEITQLTNTVLAGLPGTDEVFTIAEFKEHLKRYSEVDSVKLKENLAYFLKAIVPHAEEYGIKMCIHPDDPPFPILGLPRVVSTGQDLQDVIDAYSSPNNGITLCTGSLGARGDNDIPAIISRLGSHIHFLHLRNVQREADGSFFEAEHLSGSTDMFEVMKAVVAEQVKRQNAGRNDVAFPMRPDHGHKILDDYNYNTYPGYSVIGRLKGLAELRGLEMGVKRALFY